MDEAEHTAASAAFALAVSRWAARLGQATLREHWLTIAPQALCSLAVAPTAIVLLGVRAVEGVLGGS